MPWFGPTDEVMDVLRKVKADKDEQGRFMLGGEPVTVGLGGDELIVPEGAVYAVNGKGGSLCDLLREKGRSGVTGFKLF